VGIAAETLPIFRTPMHVNQALPMCQQACGVFTWILCSGKLASVRYWLLSYSTQILGVTELTINPDLCGRNSATVRSCLPGLHEHVLNEQRQKWIVLGCLGWLIDEN
jgi:hypothetical protein